MEAIKYMVLSIWQIIQNMVGLAMYNHKSRTHILVHDGIFIVYSNEVKGMLAMGEYIFVNSCIWRKEEKDCLKIQSVRDGLELVKISRMTGPFYLIVYGFKRLVDRINKSRG